MMKRSIHTRLPGLISILLGLGTGYLYYRTQLCSGFCPLASTPFWSMAIGGFWGALTYDLWKALRAWLFRNSQGD